MKVLETDRLVLRWLTPDDAAFNLRLLNEPAWLRYIGDRGVRTLEESRTHLENGVLASYQRHGFGLYLVTLKEDDTPVGVCGLIRRDTLPDVDLGFAFLEEFHARGYAFESASAVMTYGKGTFGLSRLLAITTPDNAASIRLLGKLGFRFAEARSLTPDTPPINLYAATL